MSSPISDKFIYALCTLRNTPYENSLSYSYLGALIKDDNSLHLNCWIETIPAGRRFPVHALIDSGATDNFIDKRLAADQKLSLYPLEDPVPVRNADGSLNQGGSITHEAHVWLETPMNSVDKTPTHRERLTFDVADLGGKIPLILGYPWLKKHDPTVSWSTGTLTFGPQPLPDHRTQAGMLEPRVGQLSSAPVFNPRPGLGDAGAPSLIAIATGDHARSTTVEEDIKRFVPALYLDRYYNVFAKTTFDTIPPHSEFDHKINLLPTYRYQRAKNYQLNPQEQEALHVFLEEQLRTGRIRISESRQAAPFFFARKAEEVNAPGQHSGLRPIQDYRYLNTHTVPDRYPLPLLSEILQQPKFATAKFFTVMDIRWGFNNIRIRDGDEWKAAFTTNRGLFEPTVMFFGLCNSPATFQRMIDIRFRDVLSSGNVSFILTTSSSLVTL
jgi:hypothetical protein